MPTEVGSQNLGITTELTVLMPIRKGFVQASSAVTYATRIRLVMNTLHVGRRVFIESEQQNAISGPLERLRVLEAARWCILENDTKFLLAVSFKGPWEPYIRVIQRDAGKILDAILCNCEGYEGNHRSELGFPAFAQWVRKYQIRSEQFFSSSPDLTTDDLQYLKTLAVAQRDEGDSTHFDVMATRQTLLSPQEVAAAVAAAEPALYTRQWLKILTTFHALQRFYPDGPDAQGVPRFDGHFLRELTRCVLDGTRPLYPLSSMQRGLYQEPLAWLGLPRPQRELPAAPSPRKLARSNIQSGVLSPFETVTAGADTTHTKGVLVFLRFRTAAGGRRFLGKIAPQLTTDQHRKRKYTLNIALTYAGLKTLGLTGEELDALPREFREGMDSRAGVLGDMRSNHSRNWRRPCYAGKEQRDVQTELSTVDCLLQWQSIEAEFNAKKLIAAEDVDIVMRQELQRHPDAQGKYNGHFDFADGISQPRDPFAKSRADYEGDDVAKGDLLLGHPNIHGDAVVTSKWLLDGTFMALRKLRQDVAAFRRFVGTASRSSNIRPELLKARMMGRYADGTPLVTPARGTNGFDFVHDPAGVQCPLHSHIRRTNPRKQMTPRIVRRGFSYGTRFEDDPAGAERGMIFMAYCASLADQFEVIQQWVNGGNSTGILSSEADPILGIVEPNKPRTLRFEHNGNIERFDMNDPGPATQFVTLEWGLYFLVPSMAAIKLLADYKPPQQQSESPLFEKAEQAIRQLLLLDELERKNPPASPDEKSSLRWKQLIEDPGARDSGITEAVWEVIRNRFGGIVRTSYGVLIGDQKTILQALRDHGENFSVRRYWQRMKTTIGPGFLGMDQKPTSVGVNVPQEEADLDKAYLAGLKQQGYLQEAPCPNQAVANITEQQAFELAQRIARSALKEIDAQQGGAGSFVINLEQFFELVLARLSAQWFGLPVDANKPFEQLALNPARPRHFLLLGSYIFNAEPTAYTTELAKKIGPALTQAATALIKKPPANVPVLDAILACHGSTEYRVRTLTGIIQGFVTPTYSSLLSVFSILTSEKLLWRLQQEWLKANPDDATAFVTAQTILRDPLITAMRAQPVPALLHRTATSTSTLDTTPINAGDRVILGLVSAAREKPQNSATEILFGGDYGAKAGARTAHACPGKDMALGVMLGMLSVVLDSGGLQSEGPLLLGVLRARLL